MIEINLIPDVKQELLQAQRARTMVISIAILASIISVGVVVLLAVWVFGVQTVRQSLADGQIKKSYDTLQQNPDLSKVLTIQHQLTLISQLNASKHIDSRTFDILGAILPPAPNQVTVSDMKIDSSSDTITIQAQAVNSYQALEVFKKTIAATQFSYVDSSNNQQTVPLASDISTTDVSYGEDASGNKVLRFTVSFTYTDDLFSPSSTNFAMVGANQANATDSYLGLPTNVFSNRATDIGGSN